jgi:hypothetical protein
VRAYTISGGPAPCDIRIEDPDGKDITQDVRGFVVIAERASLQEAEIKVFVKIQMLVLPGETPEEDKGGTPCG